LKKNGGAIGVWGFTGDPNPTVKPLLFRKVEEMAFEERRRKAKEIGEFIADKEVRIKECESMVPLTHRTAGGVMSPLKGC
jgi:hypothetical protein